MSEHIGPAGPGRDLSDGATIHCMPVNDLVMHEDTPECACRPDVEHVPNEHGPDGWLYTHHSLDGRERNEEPCHWCPFPGCDDCPHPGGHDPAGETPPLWEEP